MRITLDDLRKTKAGQLSSNDHLFGLGAMEEPVAQPDAARALDRGRPARQTSPGRVDICLIRCAARLLDDDNLAGGLKPLRDAIAASLGFDDGDPLIRWHYAQCQTDGQPGVIVKIETYES